MIPHPAIPATLLHGGLAFPTGVNAAPGSLCGVTYSRPVDEVTFDAWVSPGAPGAASRSTEIYAGAFREQAFEGTGTGPTITTTDGIRRFNYWRRTLNASGGQVSEQLVQALSLNNDTGITAVPAQNSGTVLAVKQNGAGSTGNISAWYVNGIQAVTPIRPFSGTDTYYSATSPHYVPGVGIYAFQRTSGSFNNWAAIALYPMTDPDGSPPNDPTVTHVFAVDGQRRVIGHDSTHIYTITGTRELGRLPLDLTGYETMVANIGALPSAPANALTQTFFSTFIGCGRYLGFNQRTAINTATSLIGMWDLLDLENPVFLETYDPGYGTTEAFLLEPNKILFRSGRKLARFIPA